MERQRKYKFIVMITLMLVVVGMTLGFAAFSATLNISSSASVTPSSSDFNVGFYTGTTFNNYEEMIYVKTYNGAEQPTVYITHGTDKISGFSPYFSDRGQYVEYSFNIGNSGMYDAYLREISFKDVDGGSNKKCSGNGWSTESLVQQACEGISVSVSVDSKEITSTTSLNNIVVSPGEFIPVVVTISYASDAVLTDGAFTVNFGDLVLDYGTVDGAKKEIDFAIDVYGYKALDGMTWGEWINSSYNDSPWHDVDDICYQSSGIFVTEDAVIDPNIYYTFGINCI